MLHQSDMHTRQKRFQRYLLPQLGVGITVGSAAVLTGWFSASQPLLLGGIIVWCYVALLLPALWLTRRGNLRAGVWIAAIGAYLVAIGSVLVAPVSQGVSLLVAMIGPVIALPYVDRSDLRIIAGGCIVTAFVTTFLGSFVAILPPPPEPIASILVVFSATAICTLILLVIFQFAQQLTGLLEQATASNRELIQIRTQLEDLVTQRTAALSTVLADVEARAAEQARLLDENIRQRSTIVELGVPVLPVRRDILVLPLVGALDDARLQLAQERALQAVEQQRSRFLILDITGVPLVDTAVASGLIGIVQAARLLGAAVILVGVRPEVAQAIVGLGIDLRSIITRSDLQGGLEYALNERRNGVNRGI